MRIYVCVKHVPDTAANIKIIGETGYDTKVKYVANPYDEYGVEEAISLVAMAGEGEVVAVCVGSESAANTLKSVMAMGVSPWTAKACKHPTSLEPKWVFLL
ncbi:MAG: hypothetical protein JRE58_15350 [Deltaproteobacteria bacterium]|nr:hypothetical protein [Deltaproteobacteria bacterium]